MIENTEVVAEMLRLFVLHMFDAATEDEDRKIISSEIRAVQQQTAEPE